MVRFQEEWQKIALGALLHDIGKLIHRHDEYKTKYPQLGNQHQALSVWFYKELVEYKIVEDDEIVTTIIQRHHESGVISEQFRVDKIKDVKLKQLALLVSRADNYSSNERGNEEKENLAEENKKTWNNFRTTPLQSIFSVTNLKENSYKINPSFFRLREFSDFSSDNIFALENHKENYEGDLKKQIESFMDEVYHIRANDFNSLFNNLLFLIEKYTWCIASDTQGKTNDIPLYDHLKTTSAIALASYKYQMEFEKVTQVRIKDGENEPQFLIIGGDLTGIQSFIYNLGASTYGAKRLRARSFYIKSLTEILSYKIIKELELTPANIVMQAGGKFHIIAPNIESTRVKLFALEKELTNELYNKFKGEIFIALDMVEVSGKGLKDKYVNIMEDLEVKLNKKKKNKFADKILNNPIFENEIYGKGQGTSLCPVCQREIFNEGNHCKICDEQIKIGSKLVKTEYMGIYAVEEKINFEFSFLGLGIKLYDDKKEIREKNLITLVNFKYDSPLYVYPEIRGSYGSYVPIDSEKTVMEFEEIAKGAKGVKNLGVLKADVDNLGNIFGTGLGDDNQSISRVANLSKLMDTFFSKFIEETIRVKRVIKYKNVDIDLKNFYLVYAGGDDLLIVAPWNELIFFSKWLSDKFKEFTLNPNFTISCGIHLMNHSDPFYIASEKAGEMEERAKTSGKNGLAIWDRYIPWDKFDEVFISYGEKIAEYNNDGVYTQSFLYRLLKYTEMAEKYHNKKDVWALSFISKFNYDVERNLKEKLLKTFNKDIKDLEYIPHWTLIYKVFYAIDENGNVKNEAVEFLGKYMRVALNYAVRINREGDK